METNDTFAGFTMNTAINTIRYHINSTEHDFVLQWSPVHVQSNGNNDSSPI